MKRERQKAAALNLVDLEVARKQKREADAGVPEAKPIPLGTKAEARAFLEKAAGQLLAGGDPQTANAAASIVKSALAIIAATDAPTGEAQGTRGFRFVTTEGRVLNLAGRDSGAN